MALIAAVLHAFAGPISPAAAEIAQGIRCARQGLSPDSVIGPNRVTVGRWFDGSKNVPTETVTWISPGLVARWLGYLSRREKWKGGELQRRWDLFRLASQGRPLFFVALSAYPKQSLLELTDEAPARLDWLSLDTAKIERLSETLEGEIAPVAQWRARERSVIEKFEWWQNPEWADWALPSKFAGGSAPSFDLGDWYGAWYQVKSPVRASTVLKLVLESDEKTRTANFSHVKR